MYLVSRLLRPFTLASLAVLTVPTFAAADGISFGAGGFAMIAPAYEGSDEYRVRGIPVVFPVFGDGSAERSRINVRGLDDVRLSVLRRGGFDIGPIVGYSFGRDEDLSDKLDGLGDVDGG
ncbi:MAG: MipA/OmpV family protein, partial [Pseudomonadota bacterium]